MGIAIYRREGEEKVWTLFGFMNCLLLELLLPTEARRRSASSEREDVGRLAFQGGEERVESVGESVRAILPRTSQVRVDGPGDAGDYKFIVAPICSILCVFSRALLTWNS